MRYLKFTVNNYRGISKPLTVDVSKKSLFPIIGVNESGKTTILHSLFSFDYFNDDLNDKRHITDTRNLYAISPPSPTIEADIETTLAELRTILRDLGNAKPSIKNECNILIRKKNLPTTIKVRRNLSNGEYTVDTKPFSEVPFQMDVAKQFILNLPFILFFDDFRDKVDERIFVPPDADADDESAWLPIIEQLFRKTDSRYSVYQLPNMEERQRMTVLAKVQRHLNETLTKEWQNFRLDDRDALEISISLKTEKENGVSRNYLKLNIVETDSQGDKHYFYISDRSKGFFWFFNFVMKLEFNPKLIDDNDRNTIYLLDEPGSYLHASAQIKLCKKLKSLSDQNRVIYCTHSHYLLDPETIPLSSINVSDRDDNGNVTLCSIYDFSGSLDEKRSAFQPIMDALQLKPFLLDLNAKKVLIVEGIFDYYSLELFKKDEGITILPGVGADSIKYFVSLMIAWKINFVALWDNDPDGRIHLSKAREHFGAELSESCFRLLPLRGSQKKRIIQNLFDGVDIDAIKRALEIPSNCSFEKAISSLFFSDDKRSILSKLGETTQKNFEEVYRSLGL